MITFETNGRGRFTPEELEKLVGEDSEGNVRLNLPTKSVLIANHQVKVCSLIQSSDILMRTENVGVCGLVVSLAVSRTSFASFRLRFYPRYAWCLTYFMRTHGDVYIVLKKSLKWVPFVGWVRIKIHNTPPHPFISFRPLTLWSP